MSIHDEMREATTILLERMGGALRAAAVRPFDDDEARRWLEYRPAPRPGVSLVVMDAPTRKAAHRLLATGLSAHAFAQAMTVEALEEVLDRQEDGERDRHSADFWVVVFGDPVNDEQWGWRFEGHHLSVSMTLYGDRVSGTPLFLGANPARVMYRDADVLRPLALEEEVARELLEAMTDEQRSAAVLSRTAPADILSDRQPRAEAPIEPLGVAAADLGSSGRALLDRLLDVYLDRLPASLAGLEADTIDRDALSFAWAGSLERREGHYYRIQGPDLLIEYDNTQNDANHIHSVLRRPASDFGGDALRAHRKAAHA